MRATSRATLCSGSFISGTRFPVAQKLCRFEKIYSHMGVFISSKWDSLLDGTLQNPSPHTRSCANALGPCVGRPTRLLRQSWAQLFKRPWMCIKDDCRAINRAVNMQCEACSTDKPLLQGWKCSPCGTRNHRGVHVCRKCGENEEKSKGFWLCFACGENNRVDELDDNSRCGHCGYDMAPLTVSEEDALRLSQERSEHIRHIQVSFDSISATEAEKHFGDPLAGVEKLPEELRHTHGTPAKPKIPVIDIKPFAVKPVETRHSRIYRKPRQAVYNQAPPGPPGFDWMCRERACGHINPGDEEVCLQCGVHISPSEWECLQCAAINHLTRSKCFNCCVGIPVSWICGACRTATSVYDVKCRQCDTARPPTEPKAPHEVQQTMSIRQQNEKRGDWYCEACNGLNFSRRAECFQCGTARPHKAAPMSGFGGVARTLGGDHGTDTAGSLRPTDNNWVCKYCQSSNFRTRTTCWQCSRASESVKGWSEEADAPHFAKEGFQDDADAKPAEGQMNAWKKTDDWTCAKCFSKNFRGRGECHKCGAPKKLAVAPRRATVRKPVKL